MKENIRKIAVVIMAVIAVGCAGYLIWYYGNVYRADKSYEEARKNTDKEPEEVAEQDDQSDKKADIPVDFAELQKTNPDVYAWIKIEGTNINYPIVQSQDDNEYYLNHTWDKRSNEMGAIFTQTYNSKDFTDFNTVIYGHLMSENDNRMFHELHNYMDMEYLKNHQEVIIYTPNDRLVYQVFAAVVYDDRLIPYAYNFMLENDRLGFLDSLDDLQDARSQIVDDMEVTADDQVISLSTCMVSEPHRRFLVEAVLIDEE